jgi:hypothetical protein
MDNITFVGLDMHKATVCVAVAEGGRGGEVRQLGVFENRPEVLCRMAAWLGKRGPPSELLLRSRSVRIRASPFADRLRLQLHRHGSLADPDEVGRPGQDGSSRCDDSGEATPCGNICKAFC